MKNFLIVFSIVALLTACSFDILGTPSDGSYLRNKKGEIVDDCDGDTISKNFAKYFWEGNNLPKGTTEFVCIKGKAYLPNQVPKD